MEEEDERSIYTDLDEDEKVVILAIPYERIFEQKEFDLLAMLTLMEDLNNSLDKILGKEEQEEIPEYIKENKILH